MRLLTVGSLPPEWGGPVRGGAATFHAALLTGLAGREDVEVVGVLPPTPLAGEPPVPVPVLSRPEDVGRARFYEDLLERLRPDAVLMSHVAHTVGVAHARLGSPVPAVGVIHSWHNVTFSSGDRRRSALAVTREALSGLDAAVLVSRHAMEEGRQFGFAPTPRAEVIHNPVPPLYMESPAGAVRRERAGVVFLGGLIARKAPEVLVEAAALSPGLEVLLVGEGELEGELRARIAALGLGDRVRLAEPPSGDGHVPWVRERLLRAEAMCLPSRSEALPLAFVEALACGTPVVGFGPVVREIRDELGIDIGEPLETAAPEEAAAAIEGVLAKDWGHGELRRATLDHFGLDRVRDRYAELLGRVAAHPRGSPSGSGEPGAAPPRSGRGGPGGTAICVLGPSRAGTSLTARLLSLAGVDLGPERELLGEDLSQLTGEGERVLAKARHSNPGGHFEHYRLMRLNERILRALGGSWREPPALPPGWEDTTDLDELRGEARAILAESFGGSELWGWKDPRNSLTLPFWRSMLPDARYVICLREPLEVAESLRRRDGIALEDGLAQWTRYLAAALVNTAGLPRLVVPYESYFHGPSAAARLARFAGREGAFAGAPGERLLAQAIDEGLWRSRAAQADGGRPGRTLSEARSLFRVAEPLATADDAGGGGGADLQAAADRYAEGCLRPPADGGLAEATASSPGVPDAPALAAQIRRRLGPPPEARDWPLVSIVVLNRDGAPMLRRLLRGLLERTDYPRLELILVDNASSDDSRDFARRVEAPFPISILANPHNESFSDASNQGPERASGDLLLFLNNDIEPFEPGWLRELVACRRSSQASAVAATLVCLDEEHRRSFRHGYGIQHRGLEFHEEDEMLVPGLRGWEADPLDERLGLDEEPPAVAAACLLVERGAFERVGGFSRGYVYGAEDIDLCLKLRAAGLRTLLSGRSIAIHHPVSTRRAAPFEQERVRKLANRRVLWERWGPRLRREYELQRMGGHGDWPLGVVLKAADPATLADLAATRAALEHRGHRCLLLEGERAEDPLGLNYEVAVHVEGCVRYVPKPGQRNVLWVLPGSPRRSAAERARHDVVVEGPLTSLLAVIEDA